MHPVLGALCRPVAAAALLLLLAAVQCRGPESADSAAFAPVAASPMARRLEEARLSGDMPFQRRHMWSVWTAMVRPDGADGAPAFMGWASEAETFGDSGGATDGPASRPRGLLSGAAGPVQGEGDVRLQGSADAPLIRLIHYNPSAHRHIRGHQLHEEAVLRRLRAAGARHPVLTGSRTIPPLPADAMIVMSAWWPIAGEGETPMPVWDADGPTRAKGSNGYVNWPRLVSVAVKAGAEARSPVPLAFAGRVAARPARVALNRFYHVPVTSAMARGLGHDAEAMRLALLVLGRPLRASDRLALVGLHAMTAQLPQGLWGTWWWHDRPAGGPHGKDRPAALAAPWQNYRMDVAFDALLPREADGSPNICFNPWFDGGLTDGGQGNGLKANCISCHSRASYPLVDFLPVTRGAPDLARDRAYQAGQLRTGQIWSIANSGFKHF